MIEYKINLLDTRGNVRTISNNKSNFYIVESPIDRWIFSIDELLKDHSSMGIYILLSDEENKVYIGQTQNFLSRINGHLKDKDWIEKIIFITHARSNDVFTKTDLDYYEKELIELLTKNTDLDVENKNNGNTGGMSIIRKISLSDDFLHLKKMLSFIFNFSNQIGVDFDNVTQNNNGNELVDIKLQALQKTFIGKLNKITKKVLISSGVIFKITDNYNPHYTPLNKLIRNKAIQEIGTNEYEFIEDTWATPSALSNLFKGYSTNGWDTWKTKIDNKPINIFKKTLILNIPDVDDNMIILKLKKDTEEKDFYGSYVFNKNRALKYRVLSIAKNIDGKLKIIKSVRIKDIVKAEFEEGRYNFIIEKDDSLNKYMGLDVSYSKGQNPVLYLDKKNS